VEEAPPVIVDLTDVDQAGTKFKYSITTLLQAPADLDIQKILDKKKEYLLSHSI